MRVLRLPAKPGLETLAVGSVADPGARPRRSLLRVRASSLNYHDYLVVGGHIPQPAGRIPMSDGAGEVAALGSGVSGWSVGDRVMGAFFPDWTDGEPTDANNAATLRRDHRRVRRRICRGASSFAVPHAEGLEFCRSGYAALRRADRLAGAAGGRAAGGWRTVLLPGSGGLSVFMLQIAKELGIRAIVISSSDDKLARLAALGADHGINYRTHPEWGAVVRELTGGTGADLVLDIGGELTFAQSVAACRMAGLIMVVGSTSQAAPVLPLRDVVMHHIRIVGMAVGSVAQLGELVDFVEHHNLRPVIDRDLSARATGRGFPLSIERRASRQDRHRHLKGKG